MKFLDRRVGTREQQADVATIAPANEIGRTAVGATGLENLAISVGHSLRCPLMMIRSPGLACMTYSFSHLSTTQLLGELFQQGHWLTPVRTFAPVWDLCPLCGRSAGVTLGA